MEGTAETSLGQPQANGAQHEAPVLQVLPRDPPTPEERHRQARIIRFRLKWISALQARYGKALHELEEEQVPSDLTDP